MYLCCWENNEHIVVFYNNTLLCAKKNRFHIGSDYGLYKLLIHAKRFCPTYFNLIYDYTTINCNTVKLYKNLND